MDLQDLEITCLSQHSRNRKAGMLIGQGKTIEETQKEVGMVIESIDNIEVAYILGKKFNIEMPILNTVYDILYNKLVNITRSYGNAKYISCKYSRK